MLGKRVQVVKTDSQYYGKRGLVVREDPYPADPDYTLLGVAFDDGTKDIVLLKNVVEV